MSRGQLLYAEECYCTYKKWRYLLQWFVQRVSTNHFKASSKVLGAIWLKNQAKGCLCQQYIHTDIHDEFPTSKHRKGRRHLLKARTNSTSPMRSPGRYSRSTLLPWSSATSSTCPASTSSTYCARLPLHSGPPPRPQQSTSQCKARVRIPEFSE